MMDNSGLLPPKKKKEEEKKHLDKKHLLLGDNMLEANSVFSTPVLLVTHHHPVVTCTVKQSMWAGKHRVNKFILLPLIQEYMRFSTVIIYWQAQILHLLYHKTYHDLLWHGKWPSLLCLLKVRLTCSWPHFACSQAAHSAGVVSKTCPKSPQHGSC